MRFIGKPARKAYTKLLAERKAKEMARPKTWKSRLQEMMDFGDAIPVEEVMDMKLIVTGFELIRTQWGPAVKIAVDLGESTAEVLTWSEVLIDQLKACEEDLPLEGKITKEKRYYTFS